ncbi:MAG: hypothetical protein QF464_21280, partial [Myxococcota bacterium]|nr:hypothetical protein [Myxococcota bacterium]
MWAWPVVDGEERVLAQRLDQPIDLHHHPTRSLLFMVGQGTDNVLVFNSATRDPMESPVAEIAVGPGPKAIALSNDGETAFVLNAHDYTVGVIDLAPLMAVGVDATSGCGSDLPTLETPLAFSQSTSSSFGVDPLPESVQRGRRIFHNARNAHVNNGELFACATCHVEGAEDSRTWLIPEGQRQTPALAVRLADTAPFNWQGTEDELKNNMARTIERMGGLGL